MRKRTFADKRLGGTPMKDHSLSKANISKDKSCRGSELFQNAFPRLGFNSSQTYPIKNSKNEQILKPSALAFVKENATKKLSVTIPKQLHTFLKDLAIQNDMTMGELITQKLLASLKDDQFLNQSRQATLGSDSLL